MKAQIGMTENVEYRHFRNGVEIPTFKENRLFRVLMDHGILSPRAWKIPFILGSWQLGVTRPNLVTNVGFALAAGRLMGSGAPSAPTYIAVGTGSTAAAVTDTALGTESAASGLTRANGTASLVTTTVTNDTAQTTVTFSVSGTVAVTESGVFNAAAPAPAGTLLCRQVFTAVNVVSGDSLTITWKIKHA